MTQSRLSSIPLQLLLLAAFLPTCLAAERYHYWMSTSKIAASDAATCKAILRTTNPGKCVDYSNCLMAAQKPYIAAGMGAGTTLLTLIPAALSALSDKAARYSILRQPVISNHNSGPIKLLTRAVFFVVASFAGFYVPSLALKDVRAAAFSDGSVSSVLDALEDDESQSATSPQKPATDLDSGDQHVSLPFWRICILVVMVLDVVIISFLLSVIGFRSVVTWVCARDMLLFCYAAMRMLPCFTELGIVWGLRWYFRTQQGDAGRGKGGHELRSRGYENLSSQEQVRTSEDGNGAQRGVSQGVEVQVADTRWTHQLNRLLLVLIIGLRGLDVGVLLLGTGIFGSSVLMDGIEAMVWLLVIPLLYAFLQLGCFLLV